MLLVSYFGWSSMKLCLLALCVSIVVPDCDPIDTRHRQRGVAFPSLRSWASSNSPLPVSVLHDWSAVRSLLWLHSWPAAREAHLAPRIGRVSCSKPRNQ
ncbi:hypothetical protein C7974DRAFT_59247 [Boeremia exigua]|uniref:uncharacterized protein n=1 Tax=Boeremia exigua TaxID=749465 RepID=UPI001E8D24DC|nr:uncharacterized protein C7974DRAFT_59247 [Boeremia exigua]KAH6615100.1 hypothetical protein C7974DRAFT_59247 [Boeremia exigua]